MTYNLHSKIRQLDFHKLVKCFSESWVRACIIGVLSDLGLLPRRADPEHRGTLSVPLPKALRQVFSAMQEKAHKPEELVFPTGNGKPNNDSDLLHTGA